MTDTLQNVAHVAPEPLAESLKELGAEEVVTFPDVLTHGPCHQDPKRHRKLRLEYWKELYRRALGERAAGEIDTAVGVLEDAYLSAEQIGSVASHLAESRRIVVWTTPTFQDRMFLWMVFDGLSQAGISVDNIATAEPRIPRSPESDRFLALRDLELNELIEGFEAIFYPEEIYVQAGAQLWQTFGSASPRKFAISVPHTEKFFPEIATIAESYGQLFPAVDGEGATTVEVSELDATLLGTLEAGQWRTPLEVVGGGFLQTFDFIDDLVVGARLWEWANLGRDEPYVEMREASGEPGLFERREFRLTEQGEALLADGFGDTIDAPVLQVGDCRIYAGPTPWVKVIEGEHWWFERFEPEG